ncbi:MAG: tetratricopeptide repeat protein, partial [Planctomycetia bacterium]
SSTEQRALYLAAARSAVNSGNLKSGIERFEKLVADVPDNITLRNELAGVLVSAGRTREAAKLYVGIEPNVEARYLLVAIHSFEKNYDAAIVETKKILEIDPNDQRAQLMLADVYNAQKGYTQASAIYERLLSANSSDPRIRTKLAEIALFNGNYDVSLERFQALLDENIDQPALWRGYIDSASSVKSLPKEAGETILQLADRSLTAKSTDPVYLARLSWVLKRLGAEEKAEPLLDVAMKDDPADPKVRRELGQVLLGMNKPAGALRMYETLSPLTLADRTVLVNIHAAIEDFDAAIAQCRAILEEKPDDLKTERLLADVLAWKGDFPNAAVQYKKLLDLMPEDEELPVQLARCILWSGEFDEALRRIEWMLSGDVDQQVLWPDFIDAAASATALSDKSAKIAAHVAEKTLLLPSSDPARLARLGWVMLRLDRKADSTELLDKAVALAGENLDLKVRKELADVLLAAGEPKKALAMYVGIEPDAADRKKLAAIYSALQDFGGAERELRLAAAADPKSVDLQAMLGDVLLWKEDFAEAAAVFDKLLAARPDDWTLKTKLGQSILWGGDPAKALP